MKSNIDDLCDAFIAAITDVGYAPKNIENYKQVSNRFKNSVQKTTMILIRPISVKCLLITSSTRKLGSSSDIDMSCITVLFG